MTAEAPSVPNELTNQLAEGGRLIIPSGDRWVQELEVYEKRQNSIEKTTVGKVVFVPLIGNKGWKS